MTRDDPLELDIEKDAVEYAASLGMATFKINIRGQRHWPDRLFLGRNGVYFWIEFKRAGETPYPAQYEKMNRLIRRNANVYWTDNLERAKQIIRSYWLEPTTIPEARDLVGHPTEFTGFIPGSRPG